MLFSASLVCRIWRGEAQFLLWRKIHLVGEIAGDLLLASPALGRYQTSELKIDHCRVDMYNLTAARALEVISGLKGIQTLVLRLWTLDPLGTDIFSLPSLNGTELFSEYFDLCAQSDFVAS